MVLSFILTDSNKNLTITRLIMLFMIFLVSIHTNSH